MWHLRFRWDKKFIICWPILYCMVTGHLIQGLLYCSVLVLYVLSHFTVGVFHVLMYSVHILDLTHIDRSTILKFCWTACFEIITQSFQNILLWCVTGDLIRADWIQPSVYHPKKLHYLWQLGVFFYAAQTVQTRPAQNFISVL